MDTYFDSSGDIIDVATRTAAMLNNQSVADHAARRRVELRAAAGRESATECMDCGETIPEARRLAQPGCLRCVVCQAEYERCA